MIGEGRLEKTVALRFSAYAGMDVGRDNGLVVDRAYAAKAPYAFTGTVRKVVFDLKPAARHEDEQSPARGRGPRRHRARHQRLTGRSSTPMPTSDHSDTKENAMSQSHLVIDFPIKGAAHAKALPEELPPLMPALAKAQDELGTVHFSRFMVEGDEKLLFLSDIDGEVDEHIERLVESAGPVFDAIFTTWTTLQPRPWP